MPDFTREEIEEVIQESRKFIRANLAGIELHGAELRWAILNGADLRGAILTGARYDSDTKFPDDFDP